MLIIRRFLLLLVVVMVTRMMSMIDVRRIMVVRGDDRSRGPTRETKLDGAALLVNNAGVRCSYGVVGL